MSQGQPRFITAAGFAKLRAEYEELFAIERPKLVETIAWAAANGDRSENGDYIYGRKKLREIDRRLGHLVEGDEGGEGRRARRAGSARPGAVRRDGRARRRGRCPPHVDDRRR